jgi:hypothetical protein
MAAQRPDGSGCALAPTGPDQWAASNRTRPPVWGRVCDTTGIEPTMGSFGGRELGSAGLSGQLDRSTSNR